MRWGGPRAGSCGGHPGWREGRERSEAEAGHSQKSVCLPPLVTLFLVLDAHRCMLVPAKCAQLTVHLVSGMRTASSGRLCSACLQLALASG